MFRTKFKNDAANAIIYRVYRFRSNYIHFHRELDFIGELSHNNGFQLDKVQSLIKTPKITTIEKKLFYAALPYYDHLSVKIKT